MPKMSFLKKQINFEHCGNGKKLIMLHSGVMSSIMFRGLSWIYSDSFELFIPDLPCRGRSDRYDVGPDGFIELWAKSACHMAELMDMSDAALLGVGTGGYAALWAASMRPDIFSRVICDSMPPLVPDVSFADVPEERRKSLEDGEACEFFEMMHGDDYRDVVMSDGEMYRSLSESGGPVIGCDAESIAAKVLFAASAEDNVIPHAKEAAMSATKLVKNSQTVIFEKGGHPCCMSNADEFKRRVTEFVNG